MPRPKKPNIHAIQEARRIAKKGAIYLPLILKDSIQYSVIPKAYYPPLTYLEQFDYYHGDGQRPPSHSQIEKHLGMSYSKGHDPRNRLLPDGPAPLFLRQPVGLPLPATAFRAKRG